jgi:hypothetical protein
MESSSNPIGSWKERRPLVGKKDMFSLAKDKQVQGGVLCVAPWIFDFWLVLKERDLWFGVEFWQEGVRSRRRKRCYDKIKFLLLGNSLWTLEEKLSFATIIVTNDILQLQSIVDCTYYSHKQQF